MCGQDASYLTRTSFHRLRPLQQTSRVLSVCPPLPVFHKRSPQNSPSQFGWHATCKDVLKSWPITRYSSKKKQPAVLATGPLGALTSPGWSFWTPHVNPPLKAHVANDPLSSGCDSRSHAAMSRWQKLMLDIFRLPIYQSRAHQRRIYIECVGGPEAAVTKRRYPLSSGWEQAAAPQINPDEFLNNFRGMSLKFRPTGERKRNINNKEATVCPPPWRQGAAGSPPSEEMSARRESFGLWAPGKGTKKKSWWESGSQRRKKNT